MNSLLYISSTVWIGIVLTVCIAGRIVMRTDLTRTAAIGMGIGHGVGLFGSLGILYAIVPLFKKIFIDFGTELPAISLLVFSLSDLVHLHSRFVFRALIVAFTVECCTFILLHQQQSRRNAAKWIALTVSVVILIGNIAVFLGLLLPIIKLLNDLA